MENGMIAQCGVQLVVLVAIGKFASGGRLNERNDGRLHGGEGKKGATPRSYTGEIDVRLLRFCRTVKEGEALQPAETSEHTQK